MLRGPINEWTTKWMAQGRAEGHAKGRAEGQIAVVHRMAARKFGPQTAERLTERLTEISDPEQVGDISDWLIDCDDADALLARVARLCAASATTGEGV